MIALRSNEILFLSGNGLFELVDLFREYVRPLKQGLGARNSVASFITGLCELYHGRVAAVVNGDSHHALIIVDERFELFCRWLQAAVLFS